MAVVVAWFGSLMTSFTLGNTGHLAEHNRSARRTLWVERFRSVGLTDAQVIAAAVAATGSGGTIVFEAGRTYSLTAALGIGLVGKRGVTLDFTGSTVTTTITSGYAIAVGGARTVATTATVAIAQGATAITVASTAGLSVGSWIEIYNDENYNPDRATTSKGELARVKAIVGTTVTLTAPTEDSYSVTGRTVHVAVLNPADRLTVRGLRLVGPSSGNSRGLLIYSFTDARVDGCHVEGFASTGLEMQTGVGAVVDRCAVVGFGGNNYGIAISGANDVTVMDSGGRNCWHSFDVLHTSVQPRRFAFVRCTATGDVSSGISTHTGDVGLIDSCSTPGCGGGIIVRSKNTTVRNCDVRSLVDGGYDHAIYVGDGGSHTWGAGIGGIGLRVIDNRIAVGAGGGSGIYSTAALVDAVIARNTIGGHTAPAIRGVGNGSSNVQIVDNIVEVVADVAAVSLVPANEGSFATDVRVSGNRFGGAAVTITPSTNAVVANNW